MIKKNERLHSAEISRRERASPIFSGEQITHEQAEEVLLVRKKMLLSLKGDISISFYDALDKKISFERASLQEIMESDKGTIDAYKKLNKVLKSEYFVQKPLDIHIF